MCEIMDWVKNEGRIEGQNQLFMLWNWLTDSGRNNEAAEIMNPSNEDLRKTLLVEYENSVQEEQ